MLFCLSTLTIKKHTDRNEKRKYKRLRPVEDYMLLEISPY